MSTLVGKKYKFTAYNGKTVIEVVQELSPTQMLTKCLSSPYEWSVGKFNVYDKNLNEQWKEVREPRVVYINEYDNTALYRGLSDYSFKTEALARQWNVKGYIATRKFIEVLE